MKLNNYNIQNKEVGTTVVDHKDIKKDQLYVLRGVVEHAKFNGKEATLVDEMETEKGMLVVTDDKGAPPFAAFTNDSERDIFKSKDILSRIIVHKDHHIILGFYPKNERDPIDVYIFAIEELKFEDGFYDSILLRCIFAGDTLLPIKDFERVTEHMVKLSKQTHLPPQLKNKYCFQTTRKVMLCFMSKNDKGDIVSERDKRMILNTNSLSRFDKGETVDEGIFRVYYSRRFKNSEELYVEGVRVPDDYTDIDIKDFIRSTNFDVSNLIRILTTRSGKRIYAIVSNKGEIRPIIKLGSYTSFALSEKEIADNIVDIEIYSN